MSLFGAILCFLSFIFFLQSANGLNCKCTQSSAKTPCQDGICQVPTETAACLMLDHPLSGRHYACSTSKLKEGTCMDKVTKSGATVKICGCDSSDYCNYKLWPNQHNDFDEDVDQMDSVVRDSGNDAFPGMNFRRHAQDTSDATALQRLPHWALILVLGLFLSIYL